MVLRLGEGNNFHITYVLFVTITSIAVLDYQGVKKGTIFKTNVLEGIFNTS